MIELKTINDIKRQAAGSTVEAFEGTVTWVDEPVAPTAGQAKVGIHKQRITVADEQGSSIKVSLMRQHFHIGQEMKGETLRFESTPDDKGGLSGLSVTKWTNNENKTFTDIEANGSANIYVLPSDPAKKPPVQPQQRQAAPPAQAQQKSAPARQEPAQQRQSPPPARAQSPYTLMDYALFHRLCFEAAKDAYVDTNIGEDDLRGVATTIFIECKGRMAQFYTPPGEIEAEQEAGIETASGFVEGGTTLIAGVPKEGKSKLVENMKSSLEAPTEPEPEPKQKAPKPSTDDAKFGSKLVKDLEVDDLSTLLIKCMDFKGTDERALKVQRAAAKRRAELNLSYEIVYDTYTDTLKNRFSPEAINTTYDQMRGGSDNEEFCKNILLDKKTFEDAVELTHAVMEQLGATPVAESEEVSDDPFS